MLPANLLFPKTYVPLLLASRIFSLGSPPFPPGTGLIRSAYEPSYSGILPFRFTFSIVSLSVCVSLACHLMLGVARTVGI